MIIELRKKRVYRALQAMVYFAKIVNQGTHELLLQSHWVCVSGKVTETRSVTRYGETK